MESNFGAKNSTKPTTQQTYYDLLGLDRSNFDPAALKSAYKKLALRWHPDKNPDDPKTAEETFKAISEAYQVLGDDAKRAAYDRKLLLQEQTASRMQRDGQPTGNRQNGQSQARFDGKVGGRGVFRFAFSDGWDFEDPWKLFESHFGDLGGIGGGIFSRSGFGGGLLGRTGFSRADDLFERHFGTRTGTFHQQSNMNSGRQASQADAQPMTEKYIERTYHMSDGTVRKEYIKLDQSQSSSGQSSRPSQTGRSDDFFTKSNASHRREYAPHQEAHSQTGHEKIRIKYVYR